MLNSCGMANSRPTVLVTESEYRKAEACFLSAPGLECRRAPDAEADLAAAIREAHAAYVDRRAARPYTGPLYDALPAGGVIARFGVGHDGIDKAQSDGGRSPLHQHAGRAQSVGRRTHDAARRRRGADTDRRRRRAWRDARGIRRRARSCRARRSRSSAAAASAARSRASPRSATACGRRLFQAGRAAARGAGALSRASTNDFATAVRDADFVSLHMSGEPRERQLHQSRAAGASRRAHLADQHRARIDRRRSGAVRRRWRQRRLAGAALDVFAREPYVPAEGSGDLRSLAERHPDAARRQQHGRSRTAAWPSARSRMSRWLKPARSRRWILLNPEVLPRTPSRPEPDSLR